MVIVLYGRNFMSEKVSDTLLGDTSVGAGVVKDT